ncbi:hypothetical protein QBC33DRAFT_594783 [Phialemonium atrogriseum]|uniref:Haloacid dehalogenase-like hydrolase n=1 Tax=Phialemonium atrogriseum TaxID=1093897 RepID=A0AAJ0FJP8_9PEZI|nr:uncharacterized protein QBC33DRAFT_594783 [Phialemonium atrogriseum]KAK1764684.1 hypothetical protein QBC33DRAFT_594783 [Phialemonium atrogriseum]
MDIVLDFDGTITRHDTIATLAAHAISKNGGAAAAADWDHIIKAYTLDHARYVAGYSPAAAERTTPAQELAFLNGLRALEQASLDRVSDSGLFRDLAPDDLARLGECAAVRDGGGRVEIRRGFAELRDGLSRRGRIAVVSANWSADFIRGCCGGGGGLDVVAANLVEFPTGRVRGVVPGGDGELVLTARDKYRALEAVVRRWGRRPGEVVYVGDSGTDLECLLACRGIVIADDGEGTLLETLRRLGFEVRHVAECGTDFRLAWAKDFKEILDSGILGGPVATVAPEGMD